MYMQSEEEEFIISKFKRHGHQITRKCLERTVQWLHESPSNSIDTLLKKIGQLTLESQNHQQNLQHAIEILSLNNKNLNNYEDLIEQTRKRSIYPISPYQTDNQTWFTQRPMKHLFEFSPEDKLKMHTSQFKRIVQANKDNTKGGILGILYQNYSALTMDGKPKLTIQNEVNEMELNLPNGLQASSLFVSGCSYIARGAQEGRDLSFTVKAFELPLPPAEHKHSLLKHKFRQMCQNISAAKQIPGFSASDFMKYDCVYTPTTDQLKPTLIFGNVTINLQTVERLERLTKAYANGVAAVILMLSSEEQQVIDFAIWLKCKVYLIPHVSSQGPRLLPKLPLLKQRMPNTKVLTNPARLSIQGREVLLVNYPLIRSIYTSCLLSQQMVKIAPQQMTAKVSELLFSQGNVAIAQDIYWKQSDYFLINSQTTVVINDNVAAMGYHKSKGKGGMATTGNFSRERDFLCLVGKGKTFIQFCEAPL